MVLQFQKPIGLASYIQVSSNGNDASVVHDVSIEDGVAPAVCHRCHKRKTFSYGEFICGFYVGAQAAVVQKYNSSSSFQHGVFSAIGNECSVIEPGASCDGHGIRFCGALDV